MSEEKTNTKPERSSGNEVGCNDLFGKWQPIETAPKDGSEFIVYCPPAHGLNHIVSVCAWHEDAGFCVCELREPKFWTPLPNL